jgi:uncharacterized membrane protein YqhA
MFERLLKVRYVAAVVVVLAVLHALAFMLMGAKLAVHAYGRVLFGATVGALDRPGVELLHALDLLLISLVLIILAVGVGKLFLRDPGAPAHSASLPAWLDITTFTDLKVLLWETVLTALLVFTIATLSADLQGHPGWTALVLPGGILLLAMSLYFMKKS